MNLQEEEPETFPNVAYDIDGNPTGDPKEFEMNRQSCDHYDRNCSLISPCCGMVFGCRICHDECDNLCPPIFKKELDEIVSKTGTDSYHIPQKIKLKDGVKAKQSRRGSMSSIMSSISAIGDDVHHNFDRFSVTEVICRQCYTRQSSKTNNCINCNVQFGEYHCKICNLWMKADEEPYHCSACGFCRVGGRDNFEHCFTCGMCIDVNLFNDHNCKAGKYSTNCPVCYEDLFSSRRACHEMPCGHNIHWHCFNEMSTHDIRCPVCKKTATHEDMADVWDGIAMDIALQPLPPEHSRVVDIICNDCEERDVDRRWHYLGVQCRNCSSFNTSHTIKLSGLDAHSYLAEIEVQEALNSSNINSQSS
jgi:RING finger/CHY zinc finger protein 1